MISLGGILFGLFFVAFGVSCIRWNYTVANNLRQFDFISSMGGGDIYNGVKVLGIICILFGFTIGLGLWQGLLSLVSEPFTHLIGR
jgi:hypothetical protein